MRPAWDVCGITVVRFVTILLPWGTDDGSEPSHVGHFPRDLPSGTHRVLEA